MKYRYTHWRIDPEGRLKRYQRGITEWEPNPRGGATLCQIHGENKVLLARGATACGDHSFSYSVGRAKAKFRADLAHMLTLKLMLDKIAE